MANYKEKIILNGVTYDELFCKFNELVCGLKNGWDIAKVYSKLYNIAKKRNQDIFIAIICTELYDEIYCVDTFDKAIEFVYRKKNGVKAEIKYYKIGFYDDAFLYELKNVENTMTQRMLKTITAYFEINQEVLSEEENLNIYEQICYLEKMVWLELKYTTKQIFLLQEANKIALNCSKELEKLGNDFESHKIDAKIYKKGWKEIEEQLCDVWLNKEDTRFRCPIYLEDLEIPENLKEFYNSIFIDF